MVIGKLRYEFPIRDLHDHANSHSHRFRHSVNCSCKSSLEHRVTLPNGSLAIPVQSALLVLNKHCGDLIATSSVAVILRSPTERLGHVHTVCERRDITSTQFAQDRISQVLWLNVRGVPFTPRLCQDCDAPRSVYEPLQWHAMQRLLRTVVRTIYRRSQNPRPVSGDACSLHVCRVGNANPK